MSLRLKIEGFLVLTLLSLNYAIAREPSPGSEGSPRYEKIINSNWTFNYFPSETADRGYETIGFNDSQWPAVSIPHTWSTFETTGEVHPFIRSASEKDNPYWWTGWGWYRKHFSVSRNYSDRKVFIEFEGVQKYCKVWINGKYMGDHKGGYGSFDFDITQFVRFGGDNVIAVAVNNRQNDSFSIPPMSAGNFNVYGGIYRDVTLVLKDKLYIPMQGSASHEGGTFVTTPSVSEKEGMVNVRTWVTNDYDQPKKCSLRTVVIDPSGRKVLEMVSDSVINQAATLMFVQEGSVANPSLWSPEAPNLYRVVSEVSDGGRIVDAFTSPLGFRWFYWDYQDNFLYVNGSRMIVHGGNRHQEFPWLGDAIPKWITMMDYRDMAENLKYNFMRTAHYPNDKLVYDLADKYGIVIDEESPSIKNQDFSPEVQEQQMKEMIRRDRNHPSIMFWSMGNETNHAVDSKYAIAEDSTRILTARRVTDGSEGKYVRHNDENLAIESLLRCTIRGWYNKDVRDLEPADPQHSGTEEHQQNMLKASGRFGTGNLCTWLYEDHGADREYLNSPLLHVNPKGYVDVYRIPKYAYYFWQANYDDKPMVFIQPHFWRSQYLGQNKDIVVNSNCDTVELMVNGVSQGFKFPADSNFHSVTFKRVPVLKGTLSAIAMRKGKFVKTDIVMAGEPARVVIKSSHTNISADRGSVAIITADIVDTDGNHVYGANNIVSWSVSGPAKLVGPSLYESDIDRHQEMEGVWYIDMPVSNVIRSTGKQGKIKVTVSSSGLASGSVVIDADPTEADISVISEPVLDDDGRKTVARNKFVTRRLNDVPAEIKPTFDELSFSASDRDGYAALIKQYILKNNLFVDTVSVEFSMLVNLLAVQLDNNKGNLIADDYNFNIRNYNNCRIIAGYINATKLPAAFQGGLRTYYAGSIIGKGSQKDPGEEMNWLNWIPSGGTVVISRDEQRNGSEKDAIYTTKTDLSDIIAIVHPSFRNFSTEGKERALTFISKMNPYIKVSAVSIPAKPPDKKATTRITYTAERGKPILIPLFKFIAD